MIQQKLDRVFGHRKRTKNKDCLEYCCPKCDPSLSGGDKKYNLSLTLSKGVFHCWACGYSGTLNRLLRENLDDEDYDEIVNSNFLRNTRFLRQTPQVSASTKISISNVRSLTRQWPDSLHYRAARHYLEQRGISDSLIEKWNICYTEKGINKFRILIFSKDNEGTINYCIARAFYDSIEPKYMNVDVPKHSIIFGEDKIDWKSPVVLTEGIFDSIIVWNAIPILGIASGKEILLYHKLIRTIRENHTPIILGFDADAKKKTIEAYTSLSSLGIDVKIINVPDEENDLNKYYVKYGKKKLIELLDSAHKPTLLEELLFANSTFSGSPYSHII